MELKGAVAAITGASRGLGRELALALARQGANLRVCARNEAQLLTLKQEAEDLGVDCQVCPLDLTGNRTSFEILVATERVDILVNNAGMAHPLKPLEAITNVELFRLTWLNTYIPILLMQAVIPGMKQRGSGTIINVCSLAGRRGIKNLSVYCGTKFALRGITEAVAQDLEGSGVTCWSLSPGGMATKTRADTFGAEDAQKQQDPRVVASITVDILAGKSGRLGINCPPIPNGADLVVRRGCVTIRERENWP